MYSVHANLSQLLEVSSHLKLTQIDMPLSSQVKSSRMCSSHFSLKSGQVSVPQRLPGRVFNRPEFSGRHDFQAKKFGRQCTKSGSHATGLQEKTSKNLMQKKTYYIRITNAPPT